MKKSIVFRQKIVGYLYTNFAKKVFFMFDAELMHSAFIKIGKFLGEYWSTKKATGLFFDYQDKCLEQEICGVKFRNPVGLAAGFDKNAEMISIMENVGFGFSEVGSISGRASKGNTGQRMKRLIKEKSLWINLGLNNCGAEKVYRKLSNKRFKIPFGVSIARTNSRETAEDDMAIEDYCFSAEKFRDIGNYLTINISCPNAYGGQPFSSPKRFEKLMKAIAKLKIEKPIFVKLSPDLDKENVNSILKISEKYGISGFICTNLTKHHQFNKGGVSGKILEKKSDEMLGDVYRKMRGKKRKFILIGCGGIFSAEDAYKKIKLGANLVQLITGMVFQGPGLIGKINYELAELLKKDGFKNVSEAVGKCA
ncbi:MAG: quinone-dependent dihydroorotate dehydrogenase [Nanoarchaeota archaeon]